MTSNQGQRAHLRTFSIQQYFYLRRYTIYVNWVGSTKLRKNKIIKVKCLYCGNKDTTYICRASGGGLGHCLGIKTKGGCVINGNVRTEKIGIDGIKQVSKFAIRESEAGIEDIQYLRWCGRNGSSWCRYGGRC